MARENEPSSVPGYNRRDLCQILVGSSASVLFAGYSGRANGQAKPAAVAELAMYAASDRQQMLEEGAKREGQIVQYGSYFDKIIQPMFNIFKQKYPYLEMSLLRAEPIDATRRIQEEHQANRDVFDVVQSSIIALNALKQRGLITPYKSPPTEELSPQFRQPDGYWVAFGESILCIGYNTNIVKPSEAPKSYEDLLDPKWRGMIAMPSGSTFTHWMEGLIEIWGEDRAQAYFDKLKLNQPRLRAESARAVVDLVAAGQIPISAGVLNAHMATVKQKGAPVDWSAPDPAFCWIQGLSLSANAPHPHASLLWIDWLLTQQGAQALADVGYIPVDPRVKMKWPHINDGNLHVVDEIKEQGRLQELTKLRDLIVFG